MRQEVAVRPEGLREWLGANPGPWDVCLYTVAPGQDPDAYTAGRVVFRADRAEFRDGVVLFVQDGPAGPVGEVALVEAALGGPEAGEAPDGSRFWRAHYVNLGVGVEGFYPYVVVVVGKKGGA